MVILRNKRTIYIHILLIRKRQFHFTSAAFSCPASCWGSSPDKCYKKNPRSDRLSYNDTAKNLTDNIKKICKYCVTCIKNKSRGQRKFGLMSQSGPAKEPFKIVSIGTIGGFGSRSIKKYLHLLVDHFTRFRCIVMCSSTIIEHKNESVAKQLCMLFPIRVLSVDRDVVVDNTYYCVFMIFNKHTLFFYNNSLLFIYCMCV